MKQLVMVFLMVLSSSLSFGAYQVGDVVDDFDFLESNGGTPVTNSIHGLIDEGKVVFLNFATTT